MSKTKAWAKSHGVAVADVLPPVSEHPDTYPRTAKEVAIRSIILHGVAAVGFGVESGPIVKWLKDQTIWKHVTAKEKVFLGSKRRTQDALTNAGWRCESEWALLWAIGKVESLGLPTKTCDTARLVDEIMPELGSDISDFISTARLRPPGELLAEEDRIYNLHCYARIDLKSGKALPDDLQYSVLYERHYALDWLRGAADWDDVTCDT